MKPSVFADIKIEKFFKSYDFRIIHKKITCLKICVYNIKSWGVFSPS